MSGKNQRYTRDLREDTSYAHYVKWEVSMKDLNVMRGWPFVKKYRTFCPASPTLWDFQMTFPEVGDKGKASLCLHVQRVDDLQEDLDATVKVDIMDIEGALVYPRQIFENYELVAGSGFIERVDLAPFPNMESAVHQRINISVKLGIYSCHGEALESSRLRNSA